MMQVDKIFNMIFDVLVCDKPAVLPKPLVNIDWQLHTQQRCTEQLGVGQLQQSCVAAGV